MPDELNKYLVKKKKEEEDDSLSKYLITGTDGFAGLGGTGITASAKAGAEAIQPEILQEALPEGELLGLDINYPMSPEQLDLERQVYETQEMEVKNSADYIIAQGAQNSLMHKLLRLSLASDEARMYAPGKGGGMEGIIDSYQQASERDKQLTSDYVPTMMEETGAFALSMFLDSPIFGAFGQLGAAGGKSAVKGVTSGAKWLKNLALKMGMKPRTANKYVANVLNKTGKVAEDIAIRSSSTGTALAGHTLFNDLATQLQEHDIDDVDYWEALKHSGQSFATGAVLGPISVGGSALNSTISRNISNKLGKIVLGKTAQGVTLGAEAGAFTLMGAALEGQEITGQNFLINVANLLALKAGHSITGGLKKSMSFKPGKENSSIYKIELSNLEKERLGFKPEEPVDGILEKINSDQVMKDKSVPMVTKQKILWGKYGVKMEGMMLPETVEVSKREDGGWFVEVKNLEGDVIDAGMYNTKLEATKEAGKWQKQVEKERSVRDMNEMSPEALGTLTNRALELFPEGFETGEFQKLMTTPWSELNNKERGKLNKFNEMVKETREIFEERERQAPEIKQEGKKRYLVDEKMEEAEGSDFIRGNIEVLKEGKLKLIDLITESDKGIGGQEDISSVEKIRELREDAEQSIKEINEAIRQNKPFNLTHGTYEKPSELKELRKNYERRMERLDKAEKYLKSPEYAEEVRRDQEVLPEQRTELREGEGEGREDIQQAEKEGAEAGKQVVSQEPVSPSGKKIKKSTAPASESLLAAKKDAYKLVIELDDTPMSKTDRINEQKDILKQFIKDNRKDLEQLAGRSIPTMLNRVNEIKTVKTLEKAMDYMTRMIEDTQFRTEFVEIDKAQTYLEEMTNPESKAYNKKSGIARAKLEAPEFRRWTDDLKNLRKMMFEGDRGMAEKRLEEINEMMEKGEEITEKMLNEYDEMQMTGIKDMSLPELKNAQAILDARLDGVKSKARQQIEAKRLMREQQSEWMQDRMTPEGKEVQLDPDLINNNEVLKENADGGYDAVKVRNSRSLLDLTRNSSWWSLLDKLDMKGRDALPFRSEMVKVFGDPWHKTDNAYHKGVKEISNIVSDKFREVFGEDYKLALEMNDKPHQVKYKEFGKEKVMNLSQNEAYVWWQKMQDPSLNETMVKMGLMRKVETGERIGKAKEYTYEITDKGKALENFLTPEVKEWARWQIDELYPSTYERYNPAYRDYFFRDMPKNEKFSPLYRESDFKGDAIEDFMNQESFTLTANNRSLYKRTGSTNPLKKISGDRVLFSYLNKMEYFAAKGGALRELNYYFGKRNKAVRETIRQMHGKKYLEVIDSFLEDFSTNMQPSRVIKELDWIRKNFTVASLAIKPTVFIKQLMSIPAYSTWLPAGEQVKGMVEFFSDPVKNWKTLMESDYIRNRYDVGFDRDMIIAMAKDYKSKLGKMKSWKDQAMFLVKWGDRAAIMMGGFPVYNHYKNLALKEGLSEFEAHRKGLHEFEMATRFSQQASEAADLSYWQRHSSFSKFLTMYMTAPSSYHRMASAGMRRMVSGAQTGDMNIVARGAKAAIIGHVLLPMLFQVASNGFRIKSDQAKKDAFWAGMLGNWMSVFGIGEAAQWLADIMRGNHFEYHVTPVASTVSDLGQAMVDAKKLMAEYLESDEITPEDIWDVMHQIIDVAGYGSGLPIPGLTNIADGIIDVAQGEAAYPLAQILGFNKKQLEKLDVEKQLGEKESW